MNSINYTIFACTDLLKPTIESLHPKKPCKSLLIWNIQHLTEVKWDRIGKGKTICSPNFKFHPLSKELWKLELSPKIASHGYARVSMKIRKVSEYKSSAFEFMINWSAYANQGSDTVTKKVEVPANVSCHELFDFYPFNYDQMSAFVLSHLWGSEICNMIIQIEMDDNVEQESANSTTCHKSSGLQLSLDKGKLAVLADIESILKGAELTDISLRSEGKEIRAHRAILGSRSSVFKSMFEHQMSEKASGSVDIADMSFDTLQQLVTYLYSGRLVDLDVKSASKLYVASDKYAVKDLHGTCSLFLKRSLTVENCLDILMLADSHSNEDLKNSAVAYFTQHSKEIFQKPDWVNAIQARPAIAFELLEVLALNRDDCGCPKNVTWYATRNSDSEEEVEEENVHGKLAPSPLKRNEKKKSGKGKVKKNKSKGEEGF